MGTTEEQITDWSEMQKNHQRSLMKFFRQSLPVWLTFLLAVIALTGGLLVGTQIKSPTQIASETKPPEPGLITARVEQRQLTAQIVARADVVFADPVEITPPVPAGAEAAVVTGRVPLVGETVNAGDVILEVSGRPVFVLSGEFPAYRTLMPGLIGPDVQQLREALNALGYNAGGTSQVYDEILADAVEKFYNNAGYPPPGSDDLSKAQAVRNARDALADAQDTQAQAVVDYNNAMEEVAAMAANPVSITAESDHVGSAEPSESDLLSLDQANSTVSYSPDLSTLKLAITAADRGVARAEEALTDAQQAAWATVPTGEVVFITGLPRRVDAVSLSLGQILGGTSANNQQPAIIVSGANISITAHIPGVQSDMVISGAAAVLTGSNGSRYTASVMEQCQVIDIATTCDVPLSLDERADIDYNALLGNVRVAITIGASSTDALVVPVAAVSANADGQAQIQRVTGPLLHNHPISDQPTEMVNVNIGLSAEGYVEIKPIQTELYPGDLVVLGIDNSEGDTTSEPSPR